MKLISLVLLFFSISGVESAVEIGGNFGYDRNIFGSNDQNKSVVRTYSGFLAWYLFGPTAIELNYTQSENIVTQNETVVIDSDNNLSITSTENRVLSTVYGIGIRQSLSSRKSRIQPMLSIGYARQFQQGLTTYTLSDNGSPVVYQTLEPKLRTDNVFGTFMLKIYLTKALSINGSIKTVFPAFEWNKAKNNLRYLAGLSWVF